MILIGGCRIGNEPELRYTNSGDAVISLSLAYNYGKSGADGKKPTQWVEASLWGKRAESLAPYLKKGGMVVAYVQDLHIESYEGKNGIGHKLAGRVQDIELMGGKADATPAAPKSKSAPEPKPFTDIADDDIGIPF